jgi:hypothetical protein
MVDFKEVFKKAIKETSAVAKDLKGLQVEEFVMAGEHDVRGVKGGTIKGYVFMVLCSYKAPEGQPDKVCFEVNVLENGTVGASYNGYEAEYRKYK